MKTRWASGSRTVDWAAFLRGKERSRKSETLRDRSLDLYPEIWTVSMSERRMRNALHFFSFANLSVFPLHPFVFPCSVFKRGQVIFITTNQVRQSTNNIITPGTFALESAL
ncbi:hypothetical protein KOW79_013525 [Hemibagrus wyckioides]|uniref:Uncharacterized protein n=1 Tax=Hemibagrus wyckioides TaxID=337641 RepID=A0A9D3SLG7_9TELE|nr:hypothetical protein KOW79_013525 [Hemibagrus wyckioides]